MSIVLACDLGSTNLRVALVGPDGQVRHAVTIAAGGDADEVDARLWREGFIAAVDRLAAAAGGEFDAVAALAISSLTRTQVFLGADQEPLRPAITWRDTRAQKWMERIRSLLPAAHPEAAQLTAFHPLARLAWLACEEPETARQLHAVIEPKDYLNLWLTGECTIDPVGSARLLAGQEALEGLGYDDRIVSRVVEPGTAVGGVRAGLPNAFGRLAGRPVFAMGNDTWASVVGLGALRDGYAYNLSGTTEVLGVVSKTRAAAEGLLTVDWRGGLTQLGGPSQTGADSLTWLMSLIGEGGTEALEAVLAGPRDPQPLLFLPYLSGERTPHWGPGATGGFRRPQPPPRSGRLRPCRARGHRLPQPAGPRAGRDGDRTEGQRGPLWRRRGGEHGLGTDQGGYLRPSRGGGRKSGTGDSRSGHRRPDRIGAVQKPGGRAGGSGPCAPPLRAAPRSRGAL